MDITLGSDGNLWFTESNASKIGTLFSNGKITEQVTPSSKAGPIGIASGPGPALNVWFTEIESCARRDRLRSPVRRTSNTFCRTPPLVR